MEVADQPLPVSSPHTSTSGLVVVSGAPGVGKTSIARGLAEQLGWPLLSKDTIKETLADHLGLGDDDWSQRLGGASFEVVFALLKAMPFAVVETAWRTHHRDRFLRLARPTVEVFCVCDPLVQVERLRSRVGEDRHPIHREVIDPALIDQFVNTSEWSLGEPLGLGGALITVDTTEWPDMARLVADVHCALDPGVSSEAGDVASRPA